MAKLEIIDDCLTPEKFVYLTYSGPDPWGVARKITDSIRPLFHVSASGMNNSRINWDVSGDPINFYSTWWVKKDLSRFSIMKVYIKIQGVKSKTDNTGNFTMQLNADLITKFEGLSIFLKPIWHIYSYLFYNKARRRFIEQCRDFTMSFRNEIKEHYNMETLPAPAHAALG